MTIFRIIFSSIKSKLVKTSLLLVFVSANAQAFLPNGKMTTYSFKEQSEKYNYKISGQIGYVSHLNNIFSAEKATVSIYKKFGLPAEQENSKIEIQCDEITFELNNNYIGCVQSGKYVSFDLKTDKWSHDQ